MSSPPKSRAGRAFPLVLERIQPEAKTFVGLTPSAASSEPMAKSSGERARGAFPLRPQRPLQQLADDRARDAQYSPGRVASDFEPLRRQMVQRLQGLGLRDERVSAALLSIPRHHFVEPGLHGQAYEDTSLPIGFGQTISKPSVVARMLELLCAGRGGAMSRVLEIGTGCGYQAALLGCLAKQVVSIERLGALHSKARALLAPLRAGRLQLVHGDGRLGHLPLAPYDGIIAAAGGAELPPAWLEQLAPGGRLVAPLEAVSGSGQALMVVERLRNGRFVHASYEAVHFVPLKSGVN